jgi:hypothetical protein
MGDLDLRLPSGLFFALLGAILCAAGVFSDARAPLTDTNVNLYCGVAMLCFGGFLLWLARRAAST